MDKGCYGFHASDRREAGVLRTDRQSHEEGADHVGRKLYENPVKAVSGSMTGWRARPARRQRQRQAGRRVSQDGHGETARQQRTRKSASRTGQSAACSPSSRRIRPQPTLSFGITGCSTSPGEHPGAAGLPDAKRHQRMDRLPSETALQTDELTHRRWASATSAQLCRADHRRKRRSSSSRCRAPRTAELHSGNHRSRATLHQQDRVSRSRVS